MFLKWEGSEIICYPILGGRKEPLPAGPYFHPLNTCSLLLSPTTAIASIKTSCKGPWPSRMMDTTHSKHTCMHACMHSLSLSPFPSQVRSTKPSFPLSRRKSCQKNCTQSQLMPADNNPRTPQSASGENMVNTRECWTQDPFCTPQSWHVDSQGIATGAKADWRRLPEGTKEIGRSFRQQDGEHSSFFGGDLDLNLKRRTAWIFRMYRNSVFVETLLWY